jgi:BASS family bile acid:Na+ symporter
MYTAALRYLAIVTVALFVGIVLPQWFSVLSGFSTVILGAIFLITALQLDVREVFRHMQHVRVIATVVLATLIVVPVAVFYGARLLVPELALALLLLAAMPAGMTSPLLTKVAGGREAFALVLAVTTSLLAPVTVPLITLVTAGSVVEVDVLSMARSLAYIIVVPFILGEVVKRLWPPVKNISQRLHPLSLVLLGLLVAGLVAEQASIIREWAYSGDIVVPLLVLFTFFVVLHGLGYVMTLWTRSSLRTASVISLTYMNFTLAIYLANTYFPEPSVVVPTTLAIIPWALLLAPFMLIDRWVKGERAVS